MAKKKARKPLRKAGDLRADIVEHATHLFAQHGYAAVAIRDICKACGVHISGVYRHFRDKQTLYDHCVLNAFFSVREETFGLLDRGLSDREVLFRFTRALSAIYGGDGDVRKFILRQLLEQDTEGRRRLLDAFVAQPSQELARRAENVAGPGRGVDLMYRIYAMTLGFANIQPTLAMLGWELPEYDDLNSMSVAVLSMACPRQDWSEFRDAAPLDPAI